ncbi:MAG: hypothetical protein JNL90_05700 [Planctomycetes bacterium]|nr:hypothetical protein [Planctomycetota bacterium]
MSGGSPARGWRDSIALAIAWRYATHAVMLALALWHEPLAAPSLPDRVLAQVPRIEWIARANYWLWLAAWVPLAIALLVRDRALGVRFLWLGGWLSLLRGACVVLTGLGPVDGLDRNAGASFETLRDAWVALVNPVSALLGDAPHVALTKDLFFSGHVATTFLLWLYCRRVPGLGRLALAAQLATTAVVFLSHLHYAIDVVGAYAITFAVYALCEGWPPRPAEPRPPLA